MQSPLWIKDSLPVSTLSGVIFSLKRLSRDGEITAMKANGINIHNAILPLIFAGLLFSFIGVFLNTRLVPETYVRRTMYLRVKLKGLKADTSKKWRNLVFSGTKGEKFTIDFYNYTDKVMKDVTIDYISKKYVLERQIKAKKMIWQNDGWILRDGVQREFSSDGKEISKETKFNRKKLIIPDKPEDFLPSTHNINEMSQSELKREIRRLRTHGMTFHKQLSRYYFRYAYPFASLVVTMIAIPFCLGMTGDKLKQMLSVAYIVGISFVYYVVLNVGRAFGTAGSIPPVLGAWLGNIIFLSMGFILFLKIRR
jgi:lipopolysaccharide export system permease protein